MELISNRLKIRQFEVEDCNSLYELNLDPTVLKFTSDVPFESVEESKLFIENYDAYSKYGFGRWAVIRKSDEQFLGWCGLKYHPEENYVDLGFRFFQRYWNKGYATESGRRVVAYAFSELQLKVLVARVESTNASSIAVLKKLGFSFQTEIRFNKSKGLLFILEKS